MRFFQRLRNIFTDPDVEAFEGPDADLRLDTIPLSDAPKEARIRFEPIDKRLTSDDTHFVSVQQIERRQLKHRRDS